MCAAIFLVPQTWDLRDQTQDFGKWLIAWLFRESISLFLYIYYGRQLLESLSFALYVKRQTPGKEKFYGIRQ
jgi:hypothetical protein